MPPWYVNLIGAIVLVGLVIFGVYTVRKRLLRLWKEVSSKEILFYRQLERTAKLCFSHKDIFMNDDNKECFKVITRYRKKRVRSLLMQTRQNLFQAITAIYTEYEDSEETVMKELITSYDMLQKIRRVYNSRVLVYNQTINIFPTRYLAIRLHLELKEYFG
jgi:hypothetical protein